MTKTEARKWARKGRQLYGRYVVSGTETDYVCAYAADRDRRSVAHKVRVWHRAGTVPTAAQIDAAMVEHLTSEYDDERCPAVVADENRSTPPS
jgi:hypothetical protein